MKRFAFILPIVAAVVAAAGASQADAATTLTLSATASPKLIHGRLGGIIDATLHDGHSIPKGYGMLDVFAAPAGSSCPATAAAETKALGYPYPGRAVFPVQQYDSGSGTFPYVFDSASRNPATYVLCGYFTHGAKTWARATIELALTPVGVVRSLYRQVLLSEFTGPAHAVCSQLTPAGRKSFTAGRATSCTAAFAAQKRVLWRKAGVADNAPKAVAQWDKLVDRVVAHLQVSVHGTRASAIGGESGIPRRTTLALGSGGWLFSSAPPSIQP